MHAIGLFGIQDTALNAVWVGAKVGCSLESCGREFVVCDELQMQQKLTNVCQSVSYSASQNLA